MQDQKDFVLLLSKELQILSTFIRNARYWKLKNKVKSQTQAADGFTTIGQRKDDIGKETKGRLCFLRKPDPKSKALL